MTGSITLVGFGLACIGGGCGIGMAALGATQAAARQPEMYGKIFTLFILGAALAEALALICLVFMFIAGF